MEKSYPSTGRSTKAYIGKLKRKSLPVTAGTALIFFPDAKSPDFTADQITPNLHTRTGMMLGSKRKSAVPMPSCGSVVSNNRKRKMAAAVSRPAVPSLPEEMVEQVLLRLPVKSIIRFRAVCRSWSAMLSSDDFRCLHRAMREAAPTATLRLLRISPTPGFDSTAVHACSPSDPGDELLFTLDHARGNFVEVLTPAPCHGLTLVHDASAPAYYICNAATREVTRLPPFPNTHSRSSAGLGFDAQTRKYKVVRLFSGFIHDRERYTIKCEVYTAGGGSGDCWRPCTGAGGGVPFGKCRFLLAGLASAANHKVAPVYANGFLHWFVDPSSMLRWPRAAVISFSVTEETFKCARAPPFWASELHQPPWTRPTVEHLVVMDNQLCMVRDLRNNNPATLEIWKLLDYSSGDWSLSHRIDLSTGQVARDLLEPQIVRVIGYIGKKIIVATSRHMVHDKFQKKVHSYDLRSGVIETVLSVTETHTSRVRNIPSSRIGLFQESLAPVHKTDKEIALSSTLAKVTKEILIRLPAKSLIRTKLVCKQWLSLTQSESFIQSYLEHKNMDKRPKIMLVGKGSSAGQSGFSFAPLNSCLLGEHHRQIAPLDTKVVCSKPCHGLNLVSTEENDYLYNPCTGFHKVFANDLRWQTQAEQHAFTVGYKNVGVGFNPLTRAHFLVEIYYYLKDFESRRYRCKWLLRWCYSGCHDLKDLVPPLPVNDMPPAYLEGMMYWMCEPRLGENYERAIISFDITSNAFGVVPCPPCIAMWNNRKCHWHAFVVELGGVLCAVLADPVRNNLDIWKLKHGEWARAYIVHLEGWPGYSLGTNVVVPLAVDEDGRILLNTGKRLGLYDPVERTIQNLFPLDESIACSKDHQSDGELNRMDSEIAPLVPMLYEDNLGRLAKTRRL